MQTTLVLFAFGVVIGLSLGSRVAIREVEMMFGSARREVAPRNRVWESMKFQNAYMELKGSLNIKRKWECSKNGLRINRAWENTVKYLLLYDMKALQTWNEVNLAGKSRKRELSSQYLLSK